MLSEEAKCGRGVTSSLKSELKFQLSQDSVYSGRVGSIVDILIVNLIGIFEWSDVSSIFHGSLGFNYWVRVKQLSQSRHIATMEPMLALTVILSLAVLLSLFWLKNLVK